MMSFKLMSFNSFIYFSTMFRSKYVVVLLVMTTRELLSEQIKLAEIWDFISFKSLLMFAMCAFDYTMTLFALFTPHKYDNLFSR